MAKGKEPKTEMECGNCHVVFTGKKCPKCGNTKGNIELAPDHIPMTEHSTEKVFGGESKLKTEDEALNQEYSMSQELAKGQQVELHDNIRQTYVTQSKLRRMEVEAELRDRKAELAPQPVPRISTPQPEPQPMQMVNPFQPNTMNPQAQFMNHFMKFSADDRTEFLEQLADADPQALQTLSGFFTQQQPVQQQQMPMNPYGMPPANPFMQYPPPYMQQAQAEQQAPVRDPTEAAMNMVDKLQEMSDRNKSKEPSELTTILTAMREDQKLMNERINAMAAEKHNTDSDALNQRLGQMENKLFAPQPQTGLRDQIHSIKEMVTDLRDIGMIETPESKNTVEEQIMLDQAKHEIKKEDRELDLQQQVASAEQSKADMKQSLVSGMFSRHLHKSLDEPEVELQPSAVPQYAPQPVDRTQRVYDAQQPVVVVEEIASDAGTVRETRSPLNTEAQQ